MLGKSIAGTRHVWNTPGYLRWGGVGIRNIPDVIELGHAFTMLDVPFNTGLEAWRYLIRPDAGDRTQF